MMLHNGYSRRQGQFCGIVIAFVVTILSLPPCQLVLAQSDPIPALVKKMVMGSSAAAVTEMIQAIGAHTTEEMPKERRSRLIWVDSNSPYYKNIAFQFTEKNRLYLIRFTLHDAARSDYHVMKKTVFKDYDLSWERPIKLNLADRDFVLYGPEKGMTLYFCELTDKKTHEKAFELFDRSVSAADRVIEPKGKTEGTEQKPEEVKQPSDPGLKTEPQKDQGSDPAPTPAVSPEQKEATPAPGEQEAVKERQPEK